MDGNLFGPKISLIPPEWKIKLKMLHAKCICKLWIKFMWHAVLMRPSKLSSIVRIDLFNLKKKKRTKQKFIVSRMRRDAEISRRELSDLPRLKLFKFFGNVCSPLAELSLAHCDRSIVVSIRWIRIEKKNCFFKFIFGKYNSVENPFARQVRKLTRFDQWHPMNCLVTSFCFSGWL